MLPRLCKVWTRPFSLCNKKRPESQASRLENDTESCSLLSPFKGYFTGGEERDKPAWLSVRHKTFLHFWLKFLAVLNYPIHSYSLSYLSPQCLDCKVVLLHHCLSRIGYLESYAPPVGIPLLIPATPQAGPKKKYWKYIVETLFNCWSSFWSVNLNFDQLT